MKSLSYFCLHLSPYNIAVHIISGIQQGDEKAFKQLYDQHKDKLYYWLLGKTQSPYWAQELLQQTFIKIWMSREQLSESVPLDVQVFRVARSLVIDNIRKQVTEKKALHVISQTLNEENISNNYNSRETSQAIEQAVNSLPKICRQVFRLSREQGLTYNEIAEELSISQKTVEYHISKALGLLRKSLLPLILFLLR